MTDSFISVPIGPVKNRNTYYLFIIIIIIIIIN